MSSTDGSTHTCFWRNKEEKRRPSKKDVPRCTLAHRADTTTWENNCANNTKALSTFQNFQETQYQGGRMRRLDLVAGHLVETSSVDAAGACTRSDCVIVAGKRSAFGKAGKGAFANTRVEDLVSPVFRALLEKPVHVDDVLMGKVAGDSGVGHQSVRRAMFIAGLDETTSCSMMNRACASGLETIATMHAKIVTNQVNVGIAGGVESMSLDRLQSVGKAAEPPKRHPAAETISGVEGTYWTMGQTSEEVAKRFSVSREEQDQLGFLSQQRAVKSKHLLAEEIVPVNGVKEDEGPRETTLEGLQKLKPAFGGLSTAGNSSQVSDGCAAVLMMNAETAAKLNFQVLGRLLSYDSVGVDPKVMGIGPAVAIPRALKKANLTVNDIDVWEINEAFASQYGYTIRVLGIDPNKVNVQGGAISLGHPLGASGARMTISALLQLNRNPKAKYAVVAMCVGGGFGSAAVFKKG